LKLAYLFVGTILLVPSLFAQQGQETNEAYSATAIGTGGAAGGRSIGLTSASLAMLAMKK
jgi:hypothetical protein